MPRADLVELWRTTSGQSAAYTHRVNRAAEGWRVAFMAIQRLYEEGDRSVLEAAAARSADWAHPRRSHTTRRLRPLVLMPDGYGNRYWTTTLAGGTVGTMTIDVDVTRRAILGAGMLGIVSVGGVAVASGCAHASPQSERNIALINDYYAAYATGNPEAVRPFLAPDVVWRIPGHHPLAGDKNGPDEVVAFFRRLAEGNFRAQPIFLQAQDDLVVDIHRGWSNVGSGPEIDQLYALMFRIRDGKIVEAQNLLTDMYQSDAFYWAHHRLKPLPAPLADG